VATDVFISVGRTWTPTQETFVREVERLLLEHDLRPRTLGRADYTAVQPLQAVNELMSQCAGVVVLAFERLHIDAGQERRGTPEEVAFADAILPTPWNQIEAAMAYAKGLPLLVFVEDRLRREGLLDQGYDWYVQSVSLDPATLRSPETIGRLNDWKTRLTKSGRRKEIGTSGAVDSMTIAELVGSLRPSQLWAVLIALGTLLAAAFWLGKIVP
jgi:hypothetical protein